MQVHNAYVRLIDNRPPVQQGGWGAPPVDLELCRFTLQALPYTNGLIFCALCAPPRPQAPCRAASRQTWV